MVQNLRTEHIVRILTIEQGWCVNLLDKLDVIFDKATSHTPIFEPLKHHIDT